MRKKKYKYVVSKVNEDPQLSVITKKNVDVEFTLQELDDQETAFRKRLTELQSKRDLEAAAIENIEHFHPWVKDLDLTPERLNTIFLYTRSKTTLGQLEPMLAEWNRALEEHLEEVNEIKSQI